MRESGYRFDLVTGSQREYDIFAHGGEETLGSPSGSIHEQLSNSLRQSVPPCGNAQILLRSDRTSQRLPIVITVVIFNLFVA